MIARRTAMCGLLGLGSALFLIGAARPVIQPVLGQKSAPLIHLGALTFLFLHGSL